MGRLTKTAAPSTRPSMKVHYSKLVDEYGAQMDGGLEMVPDYLSYCCHQCGHQQKLKAEELNSIVGNAFRMAYAAQLQKQPTLQDVIVSQLDQTKQDKVLWAKELTLKPSSEKQPSTTILNNASTAEMDVQLNNADSTAIRLAPPNSIPGLKSNHKFNVLCQNSTTTEKNQSQQSTPSSDESNSPTEMNSYKRMAEKPPLIKRLAMGLTGNHYHQNQDDDSCPLVNDSLSSTPSSPTNRPLSGGYVNETNNTNGENKSENLKTDLSPKHIEIETTKLLQNSSPLHSSPSLQVDQEFKNKRISQISSSSSSSCAQTTDGGGGGGGILSFMPTPPPLPERTDSLNNKEEGELRLAPWFQAGIPREIALEILAQEPVGAFMVRESTSKPGCFALSLRVPRSFQPTGIAHYLIVRTNRGYKIKGFTKEFATLTSLITHHSVMPELLPCPLSLSRYNPSFVKSDSKRDFADIDLDPDYNTLADFRKMMADLNV
ncbi:EGFR adapter protein-like isoform X2 [Onthophagus taurus]|uniref:EGFR adapter protein-like isoform X2 n=1 Tax=Onthophagus taurus TaxID=166361 RepID=UPI000C2063F8|nr:tensin-4-like isoform X2 [Onthophagus taurus]